jgi:hypothetical protein
MLNESRGLSGLEVCYKPFLLIETPLWPAEPNTVTADNDQVSCWHLSGSGVMRYVDNFSISEKGGGSNAEQW